MPLVLTIGIPEERALPSRAAVLAALDVASAHDDEADSFEIGRPATGSTCLITLQSAESAGPAVHVSTDDVLVRFADVRITVPLSRAPFLGDDLLPALTAGAQALGGVLVDVERGVALPTFEGARSHWMDTRRRELAALARVCIESGAPLPAVLPARDLATMHAWLVRVDALDDGELPVARLLLGLDARDGEDVALAVRAPRAARARIPPWPFVLIDPHALGPRSRASEDENEAPRLVARALLTEGIVPDDDGLYTIDLDARAQTLAMSSPDLASYRIVAPCEIVDRESLEGIVLER
jgi:hypothetical protein